jgi:sulfate/thiosulfate transport system substrate-binding protein
VLVVREGNPKGITGWADLARDDVSIVTPNPGSSGSARWNILAAYGSAIAGGGTEQDATDFLGTVIGNVDTFPGSGRGATTAFLGGVGDVLISYENEAILARRQGESFDYIVPDTTLLIENPGAVTIDADPHAQAYRDFVVSADGQAAFASVGFRPLDGSAVTGVEGANDPTDPFLQPITLLTIGDDFGGWSAANEKFFQEDTGVVTKLLQEAGA